MTIILNQQDINSKSPEEIQTYINTMRTSLTGTDTSDKDNYKNNLSQFLSYLQTRVNTNPATTLDNVNLDSTYIDKETELAKKDLEIAKERVATLRNPTASASYYDSWFPLNRPLKNSSIIVIIGLGIFIFVVSFFMILNTFGFHIRLSIPWLQSESGLKLFKIFPWYTVVIFLILVIIGLIGYLRKA